MELGRRNLHPDAFTLLLGRRYNRAKKAAHRPANVEKVTSLPERTAEKFAKEHGVTEKTVRNAGKVAAAVEKLKPEGRQRLTPPQTLQGTPSSFVAGMPFPTPK